MQTSRTSSPLVVPAELVAEIQAEADKEHRPAADLLRDLVETGLGDRRWKAHVEQQRQRAREAGLADDDQSMSDKYRQTIADKISQGLQSLREGKGTDGPTFFAEMYAELDEIERQGRE